MAGRDDDSDDDASDGPRGRRWPSRDVLDVRETSRADRRRFDPDERDEEDRRSNRLRGGRARLDEDDEAPRSRPRVRDRDDDELPRSRYRARSEDDDRGRSPPDERSRRDRDERQRDRQDDDKDRADGKDKDRGHDEDGEAADQESQKRRQKRRPLVYAIGAVALLLLVGGGLYYYVSTRDLESTDDAFTDGRVVNIAPQVAGQVVSLDVTDNQFVHKGDPLIHIDPRQFAYDRDQSRGTLDSVSAQVESQKLGVEIARKNFPASLELAKATLGSSKANLALQTANLARQKGLPKQATTQQDVDQAQSSFDQAKAQVEQDQARVTQAEPVPQNIGQSEQQVSQLQGQAEQAAAKLDQSNLNVDWSVVRSPQDGWVTQRNVEAGNYVSAGQQIMALVTPDIWVTANFKETQLDRMRPGQHVDIKVDAYSNLRLSGHVDSIQRGSGSRFSAFPAQNATGNYVKIVQRVPVKIIIDTGIDPREAVPIGVSVVPSVTLR